MITQSAHASSQKKNRGRAGRRAAPARRNGVAACDAHRASPGAPARCREWPHRQFGRCGLRCHPVGACGLGIRLRCEPPLRVWRGRTRADCGRASSADHFSACHRRLVSNRRFIRRHRRQFHVLRRVGGHAQQAWSIGKWGVPLVGRDQAGTLAAIDASPRLPVGLLTLFSAGHDRAGGALAR